MSSGVLAIGDPAFGDTVTAPAVANSVVPEESPVRRSGRSLLSALAQRTWERLPGSRAECAAAARLFGQGLPDEILLDDAATEQNFKVLASTRRLLYIATHGFTTKDDLGNQELLNLDSSHAYLAPFLKQNPLYTSGLVFSGANHFTTEYGADDGILTADEISRLNLRNVEVAILSACETGTGRIVNGEGAYAVRRGFELAGVRTILSTLWKVDDLASATLMKRMSAKRDLTIPQALRAAMLEELEARRRHGDSDHPYFWAGYVSSGDWRTQLHHTAHER
jgi:CHAT domain-containing protein